MINKKAHLHISMTVTGRCNRGCKYCHFYASHKREEVDRDMTRDVFRGYVSFIQALIRDGYNITVRFSGGEPLVVENDGIFEMSDYLYEQTGLQPYIMTNGKLVCAETIQKAAEHHISTFVISCENPFKPSEGAEKVEDVLDKYLSLQNDRVPLMLGLVVVENSEFKNLPRIADFFYEKVGVVPPLCEKNFDTYEKPTEQEIAELKQGMKEIIKKYNGITDIHAFPYIIPELYNNLEEDENEEYLIEFPLDDIHGYCSMSFENAKSKMSSVFDINNRQYSCDHKECDLHDYCKIIKWVWFDSSIYPEGSKLNDYCRIKKALVEAYYEALCCEE